MLFLLIVHSCLKSASVGELAIFRVIPDGDFIVCIRGCELRPGVTESQAMELHAQYNTPSPSTPSPTRQLCLYSYVFRPGLLGMIHRSNILFGLFPQSRLDDMPFPGLRGHQSSTTPVVPAPRVRRPRWKAGVLKNVPDGGGGRFMGGGRSRRTVPYMNQKKALKQVLSYCLVSASWDFYFHQGISDISDPELGQSKL